MIDAEQKEVSSEMMETFKTRLHAYRTKHRNDDKTENSLRQALKEKERRIQELLQYEYSAKKAVEQKNRQQEALDHERQVVKSLEREREDLQMMLVQSRSHAQHLEKTVESLQKQAEELSTKNQQLLDCNVQGEEVISRLSKENGLLHQQRLHLENQIQQEKSVTHELNTELQALYNQFETLKQQIRVEKKKHEQHATVIQELQDSLSLSGREKLELQKGLELCQHEVHSAKQTMTRSLLRLKELENRYAEAVQEKLKAFKSLQQQQAEFEKQQHELEGIRERLRLTTEREKTEKEIMTKKLASVEEISLNLQRVMEDLEMTKSAQEALEVEKRELQKKIDDLQLALKDKQTLLEEAQHHLAKKVREAAQCSENVENLQFQKEQIEKSYQGLQILYADLQAMLHSQNSEKSDLQLKIEELEKACRSWEEKWLLADRQEHELAKRVNALEKVEQLYLQLQSLLSGFGTTPSQEVFDPTKQESSPSPKVPFLEFGTELYDEVEKEDLKSESRGPKPYPNLFDLPKVHERPKQSLLDDV